jgi:hypothetical protein
MSDRILQRTINIPVSREHVGCCGQCPFIHGGFPYQQCGLFGGSLNTQSRGPLATLFVRVPECRDIDQSAPYDEGNDAELKTWIDAGYPKEWP